MRIWRQKHRNTSVLQMLKCNSHSCLALCSIVLCKIKIWKRRRMGGKNWAKQSSLTEKSMRLRRATLFCSNQDARVCFPIYSAHRNWSIPRSRSYSQGISRCFTLKLQLYACLLWHKRMPQADRSRDHLGLFHYESLIFPALNLATKSSMMNRRRVSCTKIGKHPCGTKTNWHP